MAYKTPEFDQFVEDLMREGHVPGLAFAVVDGEKTYAKGYGYARRPDDEDPTEAMHMAPDTIIDTGGLSVPFTAAAVAKLVDDEERYPEVHWETPVRRLLDEFWLKSHNGTNYTREVTLEDILSHRSGLPSHDRAFLGIEAEDPNNCGPDARKDPFRNFRDSPITVTENLPNLPMAPRPNLPTSPRLRGFLYSNYMYTVASRLVERQVEMQLEKLRGHQKPIDFRDFLNDNIWKPLGMESTFLGRYSVIEDKKASEKLADGYYWDQHTESYKDVVYEHEEETQGGRLVFSTVNDCSLWLRAMLTEEKKILSAEAYKELKRPRGGPIYSGKKAPFGEVHYALGWYVEKYCDRELIGHTGSAPGYRSVMRFSPDLGWGAVVFANSASAFEVVETVFMRLLEMRLQQGEKFDPPEIDWYRYWRKCRADNIRDKQQYVYQSEPGPLSLPLKCYTGTYHNDGYRNLNIEIKDGKLYSDCSDRSFPFELFFEHDGKDSFKVSIRDLENSTEIVPATFWVGEGTVKTLEIPLEKYLDESICFVRAEQEAIENKETETMDIEESGNSRTNDPDSMELCESDGTFTVSLPIR